MKQLLYRVRPGLSSQKCRRARSFIEDPFGGGGTALFESRGIRTTQPVTLSPGLGNRYDTAIGLFTCVSGQTAMADESDDLEETLRRLQEGDPQALASLFALHKDRLRRMVELRLDARLRGRVSASDILQEAYIARSSGSRTTRLVQVSLPSSGFVR